MLHPNRLLLVLLLAGLGTGAPTTQETPLTAADIRQLFASAKYTEVVRGVAKITSSREWQSKKTDAYDLYMLKAEAHLHMKENALASTAFDLAAKSAKDPAGAGLARSTSYLIKHSTGMFYSPKATINQHVAGGRPDDHPKIEILEPDKRKEALTALYQDQKNAAAAKLTAATDNDNKSIQAVIDAAPLIPNLRDFDFGANGNDDDTKKTSSTLADRGRDLLTEMADKMTIRVDVISSEALTVERTRQGMGNGGYVDRWRKHGMDDKQKAEMNDIFSKTDKIAVGTKILADNLATEKDFFDKLTKDNKRNHDLADKTLKANYQELFVSKTAAEKS